MLISQAVLRRKVGPRRERPPAWHRATTRKAILDSARELFAANGTDNTSLAQIAEHAGFAPPTVYAYFVRKADLIAAIVADDLSSFARKIVHEFPFSEPKEEEEENIEYEVELDSNDAVEETRPEPHCDDAMPYEDVPAVEEVVWAASEADYPDLELDRGFTVEYDSPDIDAPSEFTVRAESKDVAEQTQADDALASEPDNVEQLDTDIAASADVATESDGSQSRSPNLHIDVESISAIEARVAQLEARRADPWLERRLREFERMLSALEQRVASSTETSPEDDVDKRIGELSNRLASCEKQFEVALAKDAESRDAKLRESWNELRTLVLDATGRLEVLEREFEFRAVKSEFPTFEPEIVENRDPEPAPVAWDEPKETAGSDESYLAAARRAAMTAQSLANADERTAARGADKTRTWVLFGGCIVLGLVLAVAGIFLDRHASSGVPHAVAAVRVTSPFAHTSAAIIRQNSTPTVAPVSTDNARMDLAKGWTYLNAQGVAENDALASRFLGAAAQSGNPVAQYWFATLFEHGKGEPADPAEAIHWYEAAALQGNLKAMYKLAVSYAEGWGARQNYSEAARWFSRAAEFGFVNAQYNLGVLYERGLGVPQSLLDAYKWYALAAANGDKVSAERVDALTSQLNANDLATAREAVSAFKPLTVDAEANADPAPSTQSSTAIDPHIAKH